MATTNRERVKARTGYADLFLMRKDGDFSSAYPMIPIKGTSAGNLLVPASTILNDGSLGLAGLTSNVGPNFVGPKASVSPTLLAGSQSISFEVPCQGVNNLMTYLEMQITITNNSTSVNHVLLPAFYLIDRYNMQLNASGSPIIVYGNQLAEFFLSGLTTEELAYLSGNYGVSSTTYSSGTTATIAFGTSYTYKIPLIFPGSFTRGFMMSWLNTLNFNFTFNNKAIVSTLPAALTDLTVTGLQLMYMYKGMDDISTDKIVSYGYKPMMDKLGIPTLPFSYPIQLLMDVICTANSSITLDISPLQGLVSQLSLYLRPTGATGAGLIPSSATLGIDSFRFMDSAQRDLLTNEDIPTTMLKTTLASRNTETLYWNTLPTVPFFFSPAGVIGAYHTSFSNGGSLCFDNNRLKVKFGNIASGTYTFVFNGWAMSDLQFGNGNTNIINS